MNIIKKQSKMKFGLYEVVLMNDVGEKFRERVIKGKSYVVAEPGREYCIKVLIHRDATGNFPVRLMRVGLFVDGIDVNYWKRLDCDCLGSSEPYICTTFWGFKKNATELKAFVFSQPGIRKEQSFKDITEKPLGQLKVVVYEAVRSVGIFDNRSGNHDVPASSSISDGRKFWQQASAVTQGGRTIESSKEKFDPIPRWANKSFEPLNTIICEYHTNDMLDFLENFSEKTNSSNASVNDPVNSRYAIASSLSMKRELEVDSNTESLSPKRRNDTEINPTQDDIKFLPVTKIVPLLDLTEEENAPSISYVTLGKL